MPRAERQPSVSALKEQRARGSHEPAGQENSNCCSNRPPSVQCRKPDQSVLREYRRVIDRDMEGVVPCCSESGMIHSLYEPHQYLGAEQADHPTGIRRRQGPKMHPTVERHAHEDTGQQGKSKESRYEYENAKALKYGKRTRVILPSNALRHIVGRGLRESEIGHGQVRRNGRQDQPLTIELWPPGTEQDRYPYKLYYRYDALAVEVRAKAIPPSAENPAVQCH